jgi:hypothetical protein
MFTAEQRDGVRLDLLEFAARDSRISGAAITGSGSTGQEDQWSDIDLAFGVAEPNELSDVLADWTAYMYGRHLALHHVDVKVGAWLYRVFLLPSTLQIDLAFAPAAEFRPLAPTFRLVSGTANEPHRFPTPQPASLIGMGWLYALHARSCIARRRSWQAEYMISGIRDNALALACIRHGLSPVHARGIDSLPDAVAARFESSLVRRLDASELARAFRAVIQELLLEIRNVDAEISARLENALTELAENPP